MQRLVLSRPSLPLQPLKLRPGRNPRPKETSFIEVELDEAEIDDFSKGQSHFVSTLAAINEESMIRFSPRNSKRNSFSICNPKLNISNIIKNGGGQDTLLDDEDHLLITRLIQKYHRDFAHLNGGVSLRQTSNS